MVMVSSSEFVIVWLRTVLVLPTYARTLDFWREFWIQKIKDPKTFWIQDQGQEVRKPLGSKRCENLGKPLGSKDTKNLLDPKDTPPPPPTHDASDASDTDAAVVVGVDG